MKDKKGSNNFLTPNQAAHFLNVSLSTLKKFIYSGRIKTLKTPGGHHRIRKSDLFKMINGDLASGPGPSSFFKGKKLLEISQWFVNLMEKRQRFCRGHAAAVAEIGSKIGKELRFSPRQRDTLRLACLLHDVGMLAIDGRILNKRTELNQKEYSIIKTHPALGEEVVRSNKQLEGVSAIIRQHHERCDGSGYPDRLKKDEICPEAKIISLAEAFASMTAKDSYRNPLSKEEAISEIEKNAPDQFDPQVVKAFLRIT